MTLLESGPARTDRTYWLVVGLAFILFAAWFVKDGLYGYRNRNIENARKQLWTDAPVEFAEVPIREDFERLKDSKPTTREQVYAALGQPLPPSPGKAHEPERFVSAYGMALVPIDSNGRVDASRMQWKSWGKSKADIRAQFYWAVIPVVAAIYFLVRAYKAATLRAVIDEEGLTYGGRRVPFADMVSLRDYNRKGWVDLCYRVGDQERRLRIDDQKIAKFDEIVELICEKRGFRNPVRAASEQAANDDDDAGALPPEDQP